LPFYISPINPIPIFAVCVVLAVTFPTVLDVPALNINTSATKPITAIPIMTKKGFSLIFSPS